MRVTIIGDGAMATTCGLILASNGHAVNLWSPFADHLEQMQRERVNARYLPGVRLPDAMMMVTDAAAALRKCELVVAAAPTQYIRPVWPQMGEHVPAGVPIVSVAKGIENDTLLLPTQILAGLSGGEGKHGLAALSGPSIAKELANGLPATVCIASDDAPLAKQLQEVFTTKWLRVYTNDDLLGVELAGATKNVIALAAGILDGLNAGYNAKSALLSRGLAEITRLGVALGAERDTFFGITGVGDLATTCFCPEGRNRSAGELLGKGMSVSTHRRRRSSPGGQRDSPA
jgi:glycerol-3-phosphate dehydrogenase (NAD(P)+)